MRHFAPNEFLDPKHRLGVVLAGCGGTGSAVLANLARMHVALQGLGHPGLFVLACDDDRVEDHNLGRQLFAPCDVGQAKASVLVTRVNRHFGLDWDALCDRLGVLTAGTVPQRMYVDVVISCVDSVAARRELRRTVLDLHAPENSVHPGPRYWLDFGNLATTGQAVLGTVGAGVEQPKSRHATAARLPDVLQLFPDMADEPERPSCSMRESLTRQDLLINQILADYGVNLLWRLLRAAFLDVHGFFVNLSDCLTSPLRIDAQTWADLGWKDEEVKHA